jgi:hypothetical protein
MMCSRAAVEYDCGRPVSDTPLEEVDSTNCSGASLFGQMLSLLRETAGFSEFSVKDGAGTICRRAGITGQDHKSIATASATWRTAASSSGVNGSGVSLSISI